MSSPALRIENLGKHYRIGTRERYSTLRDTLSRCATAPFRYLRNSDAQCAIRNSQSDFIWALRNVSFDVPQGEVLGIIGRNGAGKSTLLKILSRITEPTEGYADIRGRVGSLLEVGTGFHPELTGRENIYLNGAILGMKKAEIDRKLDEIVAFAEVERFLDTPVKHYSSGMYVRLAFAVAAHLEPEILIVDEVLAVGDAQFQRKCLGKMSDVAQGGRTILFVSHNMPAVQRLCSRCVLLEGGRAVQDGPAPAVIRSYLAESIGSAYVREPLPAKATPYFTAAGIEDAHGSPLSAPLSSDPICLAVRWHVPEPVPNLRVGIGINSAQGTRIFGSAPEDDAAVTPREGGTYAARIRIPADLLLAGQYTVALCLWGDAIYDYPDPAFSFRVEPGPSPAYSRDSARDGLIQVRCSWEITAPNRNVAANAAPGSRCR
ncbi:MAG: ABC transporter ATP-binding protein [Candidatus Binatia bacterium]